jgi:hypothetical protein
MGNVVRDFRGNELMWMEEDDDLENRLQNIEEAIQRWKDEKDDYYYIYLNCDELLDELRDLQAQTESSIEEQEEDE